jgi:hypothetical protein
MAIMAIYESRLLDNNRTKERTYSGEEEGRRLAEWLNQNRSTLAAQRIEGYMAILGNLSNIGPTLSGNPATQELGKLVSFLRRAGKSKFKIAERVWKSLAPSPVRTHVEIMWVGSGPKRRPVAVLAADDEEGAQILKILSLSQKGVLDRVRMCRCCETWFFRRFHHQRYCQTNCQQKHYRSSEEWKASWREYQRDYYRRNYKK